MSIRTGKAASFPRDGQVNIESLENRTYLSTQLLPHAFATFDGSISEPSAQAIVPIKLSSSNVSLSGGTARFAFLLSAAAGSELDPAAIEIRTARGLTVPLTFSRQDLDPNLPSPPVSELLRSSLAHADLQLGKYQIVLSGQNESKGAFTLAIALIGELNNDRAVLASDTVQIDGAMGLSRGAPGFIPAADADLDGTITASDRALLISNLGDKHAIVPITLSPTLRPFYAIEGGVYHTNTRTPRLEGLADRQTTFTIDVGSNGSIESTFKANNKGAFSRQFTLPTGPGPFSVTLTATDTLGQRTSRVLSIRVDSIAPGAPTWSLSAESDTGTQGDHITTKRLVTLQGLAEPRSVVKVTNLGVTVQTNALADGTFTLVNVPLKIGSNTLQVTAKDLAGNVSAVSGGKITRIMPSDDAALAVQWLNTSLEALRINGDTPPQASRALAMVTSAMFDSINSVYGASTSILARVTSPDFASAPAAVAKAARDMLAYLYAAQVSTFDAQYAAALDEIDPGPNRDNGVEVGRQIAQRIIEQRMNDGSTGYVQYLPGSTPDSWRPTGPAYAPALLPHWANLQPFSIDHADQFRPDGPTPLNSQAFADDFNQVKELGGSTSSSRTADQTAIARHWADGAGTYTPVGHWMQIARDLALSRSLNLFDTLKVTAQLGVGMADAAIVTWDSKFAYNFVRPFTAIREAGRDENAGTEPDPDWLPLVNTPPFPEYISGHSAFSGAAERILASHFGANATFTSRIFTLPHEAPGAQRTYTSFAQAAEQASMSRVYGGIHFKQSTDQGLTTGRALGDFLVTRFADLQDTQAPVIIIESPQSVPGVGINTATNVTITGRIVDGLSQISQVQAKIDGGTSFPIAFDALGNFSLTTSFALNGTANGLHTVSIRATDVAFNTSGYTTLRVNLDTTAPIINIGSPSPNQAISPGSTFSGVVEGTGSAITELCYYLNNDTAHMSTVIFSDRGDGSVEFETPFPLGDLGQGSHSITLVARDAAGNVSQQTRNFTLAAPAPLVINQSYPEPNSVNVGVTQRPRLDFSRPVDISTLTADTLFLTSGGVQIPARIVPGDDGSFVWLFPQVAMPSASVVTITIVGGDDTTPGIRTLNGALLDADSNGTPGGTGRVFFTTVSTQPLAGGIATDAQGGQTGFGTSISGIVADPGDDRSPFTRDDTLIGPDGVLMTPDDSYQRPLVGVEVYALGREHEKVYTASDGSFTLINVPAGSVKIIINGRTATSIGTGPYAGALPPNLYFPEMTMDVTVVPGIDNYVMSGLRTSLGYENTGLFKGVFLPRIENAILEPINPSQTTVVEVGAASSTNLTPAQRALLRLELPAGSLVDEMGNSLANGQIGLSTVPAELVRDMLPPGILEHTFDLTIQAPGVGAFTRPARMVFPNVFRAAPGTKLDFLSFDHTTGRLVIEGTATVSADGQTVVTDPGTGVTKPGWHGLADACGRIRGKGNVPWYEELLLPGDSQRERAAKVTALYADSMALVETLAETALPIARINQLAESAQGAYNIAVNLKNGDLSDVRDAIINKAQEKLISGSTFLSDLKSTYDQMNEGLEYTQGLVGNAQSIYDTYEDLRDLRYRIRSEDRWQDAIDEFEQHFTAVTTFSQLFPVASVHLRTIISVVRFAQSGSLTADQVESYIAAANAIDPIRAALYSGLNFLRANQSVIAATFAAFKEDLRFYAGGGSRPPTPPGLTTDPTAPAPAQQPLYVMVEAGNFQSRSRSNPSGGFETKVGLNLRGTVNVYDPFTGNIGRGNFKTGPASSTIDIDIDLGPANSSGDADNDGLSNEVEDIVGTNPFEFDSNFDGISDLLQIRGGYSLPNNNPAPAGTIGLIDLPGTSMDMAVAGSTSIRNKLDIFVATDEHGLAVVDAARFDLPTIVGTIDLPGRATSIDYDGTRDAVVIASGSGGVHVVDVSNTSSPRLVRTIDVNASLVRVYEGVVYVNSGSTLRSFDIDSGLLIEIDSFTAPITSMDRVGDLILAVQGSNRVVRAISIAEGTITPRGSITLADPAQGKISVSNSIAYVAATSGQSINVGGYSTVSFANPDELALISGVDDAVIAGYMVIPTGSGRAAAIAPSNINVAQHRLEVLDATNPADTDKFRGRFSLIDAPRSITIALGMAIVAVGAKGLQIINFQGFDTARVAPTLSVNFAQLDVNAGAQGIQVQGGSTIQIPFAVSDDRHVRSVELRVDGVTVQNHVEFPFELTTRLPWLTPGFTTVDVEVIAYDLGGNRTSSGITTLELVDDNSGPFVTSINPSNGQTQSVRKTQLEVRFSEPLDPRTAGPGSFILTGPNNTTLNPTSVVLQYNDRRALLTVPTLSLGQWTLSLAANTLSDASGNLLTTPAPTSTFTVVDATNFWTNMGSGFWDVASNWSRGVVPTSDDDVLIPAGAGTVTIRSGTVDVSYVKSQRPITQTGGSVFSRAGILMESALYTLSGGTLRTTTVSASGTGSITLNSGTLDDVVLNANGTVPNSASPTIINDLFVNGTLTFSGTTGASTLRFQSGAQTIGGTGTLRMTGTNASNGIQLGASSATTLTLGRDLSMSGSGVVSQAINPSTLINDGHILADLSGRTLSILTTNFTNTGTLAAPLGILTLNSPNAVLDPEGITNVAGGTINFNNEWINRGSINLSTGTLRLGGTFTQSDIGALSRSGGSLHITGVLLGDLVMDAATGAFDLAGGTISGGTVSATTGQVLGVAAQSTGRLNNVTLDANAYLHAGETLNIGAGGLTLNSTLGMQATLTNGPSNVIFDSGAQALTGTGTVDFDSFSNTYPSVQTSTSSTATVLFDQGIAFDGSGEFLVRGGTLTNRASINAANVSSSTVSVEGTGTFINEGFIRLALGSFSNSASFQNAPTGTIHVQGGSATFAGTWNNTGTLLLSGGTLNLGGSFTQANLGTLTRTGGTLQIAGALSGDLHLSAATGSINYASGSITNSVISSQDGATLTTTAAETNFSNVTLNTNFTLNGGRQINVTNNLTVNATLTLFSSFGAGNSVLQFRSNSAQSLNGTGTVVLTGSVSSPASYIQVGGTGNTSASLTIASGITIEGYGFINSPDSAGNPLVNNGTIRTTSSNRTINMDNVLVTNNGLIHADAGNITIELATTNNGTLRASQSRILAATASLTNSSTGIILCDVASSTFTLAGRITTAGVATLAGTIRANFVGGYVPTVGLFFQLMSYGSAFGGFDFVQTAGLDPQPGYSLRQESTAIYFDIIS